MEISWRLNVLDAHRSVHNARIAQTNVRRVFSPLQSDICTMNSALLNAQEGMEEIY
jgi:hypothetical protein